METEDNFSEEASKNGSTGPNRFVRTLKRVDRVRALAILRRYAAHLLILAVVIIAAWLGRPAVWNWLPAQVDVDAPTPVPTALPTAVRSSLPDLPEAGSDSFISRVINIHTDFPARPRTNVITYTIQSGDTLFGIATKFNIRPETILWSNYDILKDDPDLVLPGQVINILPTDGVYYQWQAGDRLDIIASTFGVTPADIFLWPGNNLDPNIDPLNPGIPRGTWIVIPGGHREFKQWRVPVLRRTDKQKWVAGGPGACQGPFLSDVVGEKYWVWPTRSHWLSGTHYTEYHHAIDLYITLGEPIRAAASGVVVYSGWNTWGYGNLMVVDHGNGWQTVYAHLQSIAFGCGANVYQNSVIAYGGSTGNSTGPHLHFEMLYNGVWQNPLEYLPA